PLRSDGSFTSRFELVTLRKPLSRKASATKPAFSKRRRRSWPTGPSSTLSAASYDGKRNGISSALISGTKASTGPVVLTAICVVPNWICCSTCVSLPSTAEWCTTTSILPGTRWSTHSLNQLAARVCTKLGFVTMPMLILVWATAVPAVARHKAARAAAIGARIATTPGNENAKGFKDPGKRRDCQRSRIHRASPPLVRARRSKHRHLVEVPADQHQADRLAF